MFEIPSEVVKSDGFKVVAFFDTIVTVRDTTKLYKSKYKDKVILKNRKKRDNFKG